MRKLYVSLFFFFAAAGLAQAQSAKGTNPNPNAPVNLSGSVTPAHPAQHSANELPANMKGQFYVKDDKPVDALGNPIQLGGPTPAKPDAEKTTATPAAPAKPKTAGKKAAGKTTNR